MPKITTAKQIAVRVITSSPSHIWNSIKRMSKAKLLNKYPLIM